MSIDQNYSEKLRRLVEKHAGVKFTKNLEIKMMNYIEDNYGLHGYQNRDDFIEHLLNQTSGSKNIEKLVSNITVGESYFFRHEKIVSYIKSIWLPEIVAKKEKSGDLSLRIWSAGCAAGQEIYTLAMILNEELPNFSSWNLNLVGTDISTDALTQAKKAHYGKWSFRNSTVNIEKYFSHTDSEFYLNEEIRKLVKFYYLNLIDSNYPSITNGTNNLDLILCCNVIIYLTSENAELVTEKFSRCLNNGGVLLMGPSDHLSKIPAQFEQVIDHGVTIYVKQDSNNSIFEKTEFSVDKLSVEEKYKKLILVLYGQLNREEWLSALATIDQCVYLVGETAILKQFKANALANLGEYTDALALCNDSIKLDPNDAHTYLIKAMILMGQNKFIDAREALSTALLINGDFVEIKFHLGLLLLREGKRKEGLEQLYSARKLIDRFDPERKVHHAPRLTFRELAKIIENEISIYEAE